MVAPLGKTTKNHWIVLEMSKLYDKVHLNKAIFLKIYLRSSLSLSNVLHLIPVRKATS